jgi:type IX secretion system PorP/SprF family membrane protein
MRKYIKHLAVLTLTLVVAEQSKAQDIHFSQFYENAILRNPALTGIFSGDYKAGVNYRNQWSNISVPFQTVLASVESRISVNEDVGDMLSFGVTATYDRAGSISFNSFQVYPAVNFNKALEDKHQSYLSTGFTAGYIQRSVDPNKMTFSSQYVGGSYSSENGSGENITSVKSNYFDLGAGVSFNSSAGEFNNINYYIGAAAYHLNRPKVAFNSNEAFMRLNTKWNGSLGVQYLIDNNLGLTMHANYSKQGNYQEVLAGVLGSWRSVDPAAKLNFTIYGGLFYRLNDAYIPTVKVDYKTYSFTVSYDINSSGLKSATNKMGGMELSFYSRGFLTKGLWAQDKTKCPRFEQMMSPNF